MLLSQIFILAQEGTGVSWKEANLQILGIVVVFAALISIAVVVWLIGKVFIALENKKKAAASAAPAPVAGAAPRAAATPSPASATGGLTPELVAVISAAVDTALEGRRHRILNIEQSPSSPWAISGRTDIFASHRIRK